MAYQDLREFLSALEQEGQLLNIEEEVKPEPDIGAAGRAVANLGETRRRFCSKTFTVIATHA